MKPFETRGDQGGPRLAGQLLARYLLACSLAFAVTFVACSSTQDKSAIDSANQAPVSIASEPSITYVNGVTQLDLTQYSRIPLAESQLEVSSINDPTQGKDNLVGPGEESYWHIKVPKRETRPWVLIDMKTKQPVTMLGIIARKGVDQMWRGYRAVVEASDDKQNWVLVARLGPVSQDGWTYYVMPEPKAYRYIRLSTHDWNFISMARLNLYVPVGMLAPLPATEERPLQIGGSVQFDPSPYVRIPLVNSQLEVSSYNGPSQGKENLIQPGFKDFWHVKHPRAEVRAWVMLSLEAERAISLLGVKPRTGFTDQLWRGYTADLEASNDEQNWTGLAAIGISKKELSGDWIYFLVGNTTPYRYYRLSIWDREFLSMARLEIYEFGRDAK